jgi:hypothetical protein
VHAKYMQDLASNLSLNDYYAKRKSVHCLSYKNKVLFSCKKKNKVFAKDAEIE